MMMIPEEFQAGDDVVELEVFENERYGMFKGRPAPTSVLLTPQQIDGLCNPYPHPGRDPAAPPLALQVGDPTSCMGTGEHTATGRETCPRTNSQMCSSRQGTAGKGTGR